MNKVQDFIFNQQSLAFYSSCPLKFCKCCLEGLRLNSKETLPQAKRESLERGTRFHLEAERYFNGILLSEVRDRELDGWLSNLKSCFADLSADGRPEYQVFAYEFDSCLTAKYDLLVYRGGKVFIYDWKTNRYPLVQDKLLASWQTCLYRYLAVQVSREIFGRAVLPEQVTMIYWNPNYPEKKIELTYSEQQFLIDQTKIKDILSEINQAGEFPPINNNSCSGCEYRLFCQKKAAVDLMDEDDFFPDLAAVEVSAFP